MRALSALALLVASGALAGERLSLAQKIAGADLIVEVRFFGKGMALSDPNVKRVVFPPGAMAPKLPRQVLLFAKGSPCRKEVAKNEREVKSLLFFKRLEDGTLTQVVGVEIEGGRYSSLHPEYPKLVAAAAGGATFTEERMRAVGEQLLWAKEKLALEQRDNPYLMAVAAEFLRSHGASDVVDASWGKPGTPERAEREAAAKDPGPESVCPGR